MDRLMQAKEQGLYPITLHLYSGFGTKEKAVEAVDDWHEMGITIGKT